MTGILKVKIGARSRCATSRGRCSEIRQQALQFFRANPKFSKQLLFDPRNAHPRTLFRSSEEATKPVKGSVTRLVILNLKIQWGSEPETFENRTFLTSGFRMVC